MTRREVDLHLLYGIPCVGKSTAAIEFAYQRGIRTVVPTDCLRETQRAFASPHQHPALFEVTHSAWQLHGPPTRVNIEAGFRDHADAVAPAIRHVAAKLARDGFDAVIEGAHLHSGIIGALRSSLEDARVHAGLLVAEPADELRKRIHSKENERTSLAERKTWVDHFEILLVIQDYLIRDAREHGIPITTTEEWSCSSTAIT
ncbi:AAA family ATPase [Saccharopolyspora sp. NPDC003752]